MVSLALHVRRTRHSSFNNRTGFEWSSWEWNLGSWTQAPRGGFRATTHMWTHAHTHTETHSQGVTCTPTLGLPLGSPPSHSLLPHQGHPDGALGARGPGRLSSARRWLWPSSQGGCLRPLRGCADSTDLLHWTFTPSLPGLQMQSLEAAALFGWHSRKLERACPRRLSRGSSSPG